MKALFLFSLFATLLTACTPAQVRPDQDDDNESMREFRLHHADRAH